MSAPKIHHSTLAKQAREAAAREAAELEPIPASKVSPEENVTMKQSVLDGLLSRIEKLETPESKEETKPREIYT